jgi:hypothetical protein
MKPRTRSEYFSRFIFVSIPSPARFAALDQIQGDGPTRAGQVHFKENMGTRANSSSRWKTRHEKSGDLAPLPSNK